MSEYVGRTVAKTFPGYGKKKFKGSVTSVKHVDGVPLFEIHYEDGDQEELELFELKRVLMPESKAGAKRKAAEPDTAVEEPAAAVHEEAGRSGGSAGTSKDKAKAAAARSLQTELPANSVDEAQLRGVVEEVAARSTAMEVDVVRHPLTTDQAADEPKCSRAVTCGSICYISAILPSGGKVVAEDAQEEAVSKEYKAQSEDVLDQLDAALQDVGSSRDHLVSLTVLLKDIVAGREPFAATWKGWCSRLALPALTVQESYLGTEEMLVAVSAIAAVPKQQYV